MYSVNYLNNNLAISPEQGQGYRQRLALPVDFIHIGYKNTNTYPFSKVSGKKHFATSILEATKMIDNLLAEKGTVPDVIVFDQVYHQEDMAAFFSFLQSRPQVAAIPVLYNSDRLTPCAIELIRREGKVDDIVNLYETDTDLVEKVHFLKKIKNHPPAPFYHKEIDPLGKYYNRNRGYFMKRALDILIASVLLILCAPLLLIAAIAIRIDSRGPVFYTSLRAGKGYRIFRFYKLRTMEVDADKKVETLAHLNNYEAGEQGATFLKICNDPRVTTVGSFLRKTSIDELPQLINVLKGDMSLVGNRPLPLYEAASLTTNESAERFMAPAGITGLWQVHKKKKPNMTADERLQLDISYARNHNFLYDIKIMAKTPSALFQKSSS